MPPYLRQRNLVATLDVGKEDLNHNDAGNPGLEWRNAAIVGMPIGVISDPPYSRPLPVINCGWWHLNIVHTGTRPPVWQEPSRDMDIYEGSLPTHLQLLCCPMTSSSRCSHCSRYQRKYVHIFCTSFKAHLNYNTGCLGYSPQPPYSKLATYSHNHFINWQPN